MSEHPGHGVPTQVSRETAAYHEAGHAVMRHVIGGTFRSVSIGDESLTDGICDPAGVSLEEQAMTIAAGLAATAIHRGELLVTPAMIQEAGGQDLALFHEVSWRWGLRDGLTDLFLLVCAGTMVRLKTIWPAVDIVAKALLERGELSFSGVAQLVRPRLATPEGSGSSAPL